MTIKRLRGNVISAPLAIIALVILVVIGTYLTLTLKNANQKAAYNQPLIINSPDMDNNQSDYQKVAIVDLVNNLDQYNDQKVQVKGQYHQPVTVGLFCESKGTGASPEVKDEYRRYSPSGWTLVDDKNNEIGVKVVDEKNKLITKSPNYWRRPEREIELKGVAKTTTMPDECNKDIHYKSIYLEVKAEAVDVDLDLDTRRPKDSNRTAQWQTYKNNTYGFELKYPKEWQFQEVKLDKNSTAREELLLEIIGNDPSNVARVSVAIIPSSLETERTALKEEVTRNMDSAITEENEVTKNGEQGGKKGLKIVTELTSTNTTNTINTKYLFPLKNEKILFFSLTPTDGTIMARDLQDIYNTLYFNNSSY